MAPGGFLRTILVANQALQWISSVIVMSLASFLISKPGKAGEHVEYTEVIAVLNVVLWILGIILPFSGRYGGHLLPLEFIMSYLWLTAFIFQAQDYSWQSCSTHGPNSLIGFCSYKKAMEAFTFLAFFFAVTAIILELWIYRKTLNNAEFHLRTHRNGLTHNKEETSVSTPDPSV